MNAVTTTERTDPRNQEEDIWIQTDTKDTEIRFTVKTWAMDIVRAHLTVEQIEIAMNLLRDEFLGAEIDSTIPSNIQIAAVIMKQSATSRIRAIDIKVNARSKVARAIMAGYLVRPNHCSQCGTLCDPDGHHKDYDKPLDVVWLCRKCHGLEHRRLREGI